MSNASKARSLARHLRQRYSAAGLSQVLVDCSAVDPAVTVIALTGDGALPACIPEGALDRAQSRAPWLDYVDEYGSQWKLVKYPSQSEWHIYQYFHGEGAEVPLGARKWPIKRVEAEVGRILKRIFRPRQTSAGG